MMQELAIPAALGAAEPTSGRDRKFADKDGITIGEIFLTLWRQKLVFLSVILGLCAAGFLIIKLLTPTFTSTVILVLSTRQDNVVDMQQSYMNMPIPDSVIRSEADALQSRTLVGRVIDREKLLEDPEYNLYARRFTPNLLTRLGLADYLPAFLRHYLRSKPLDPSLLTPAQLKYNTATQLLKSLDVEPDAKTYSVKINFTSVDAEKAARLANAFAEEYLQSQIDENLQAANRAADWLSARLDTLGQQARKAGEDVENFRQAHRIVNLPGNSAESNTLALQQVEALSQQVTEARAQRAQLESQERQVEHLAQDPDAALASPAIAAAPLVEALRVQEAAADAHLAELKGTYGAEHPLVASATDALLQTQEHLRAAAKRAAQQLRIQVSQAQSTEAGLESRLDQLSTVRAHESQVLPRLQQLETAQFSAKTLYDAFAQGFSRALAQDGVPAPRGRIIQRADVVDWPTFPNVPIFMAIIFVASILTAIIVVYALEARDHSLRNTEDLEDLAGVPVLGMTLHMPTPLQDRWRRQISISQQLLDNPASAGAETFRLVRTALFNARQERPPKVVMVTSALPGEGKTTFSLTLGRLSALAGKKILLIEAELRKPSFNRDLPALPRKGLADYLTGAASLEEVIGHDPTSGADFIAAIGKSSAPEKLLSSPILSDLLEKARDHYDLIIIDTPPATIAADAFAFGPLIDAAILVVRWGATPRHLVTDAIRILRAAKVPLAGAVMTQVDAGRYGSYGHGHLPCEYARDYYAA